MIKKTIITLGFLFATGSVYGAASEQGCESSGNTAAGCSGNGSGVIGGNSISTNTIGVTNSNQSENRNINTITNENMNRNSNNNQNENINRNVNRNTNAQGQLQGQGQSQSTANSNNSSQTVNVQGDNFEARRIPVSTAYSPLVAPTANCALGVSGGFQTIGFGATFGKSYIDENCTKLEKIRNVSLVLGDKETAEALMCQDESYRKARATVGRYCAVDQD